ncbi:UNVERIFIED_CONTAM: Neurobeachin-like protein 2 [Siphonaria sp. JEL0065]|nr:Neurobeachin-like protein 2 [Siphonaria sp. JEL0065]
MEATSPSRISCCAMAHNACTPVSELTGDGTLSRDDPPAAFMLHLIAKYGDALPKVGTLSPAVFTAAVAASADNRSKSFDALSPLAPSATTTTTPNHLPPLPASSTSTSNPIPSSTPSFGGFFKAPPFIAKFKLPLQQQIDSAPPSHPDGSASNKHPHDIVLAILTEFNSAVVRLASLVPAASASDDVLVPLKSTLTGLRCIEILSRFEVDLDAIVKHEALDSALRLLHLFNASKVKDIDPALELTVFGMWRDLLCISLILISRCVGGCERWAGFLKHGRISGPTIPIIPGVDTARIYASLIDLLGHVLKGRQPNSPSDLQIYSDIAMAAIFSLSITVVSVASVQTSLLSSPEALAVLTSTSSTFTSVDPAAIEINLCVCHLMTYLSLVAPPGGSTKRILSDAAGLSIVSLLTHVTSTPAPPTPAASPSLYAPRILRDFEFAYSMIVRREMTQPFVDVEDAVLKVLCGEEGETVTSQGLYSLGDVEKVILGLLAGFCDPRVWILGNDDDEDGEMVVSDSEVMSRIRGVARALFSATKVEGVLIRIVMLEFLGIVFDLGAVATCEEEGNALSLKRSVCLAVMDQVDGWNQLLGPAFYAHPSANFKHLVLTFVISVAILPDTSNAGLLLNLLQIVGESESISLRFMAVRTISAICQSSRSSMDKSIEFLIKLNFLQHMTPTISTTTADEVEALDLSKTMLVLINHLSRASFNCAVYVADHYQTRTLLLNSVTRTIRKTPPEISNLGYIIAMTVTGTLLSATEKRISTTTFHSSSEPKHIINTWISSYLCCFEIQVDSIAALNVHLQLLKGIRSVMKLFPSGSLERGRIRSRLVEAKILERMVGLFSVTFDIKEDRSSNTPATTTAPALVSSTTMAATTSTTAPLALSPSNLSNSMVESPSLSTPLPTSLPESMAHVHSHALMITIGSILTGSLLANRSFKSISGFDEIKHRLFTEGQMSIWPGFLDDMIGLLVPKVMRPIADEFDAKKVVEMGAGLHFALDSEVLEITNVLVIRNLSVLEPLFLLFGDCDEGMRMRLLDYLEKLALGHEMNRVLMTQAGAVGMLLKNVLSKVEGLEQLEKFIKLFERNDPDLDMFYFSGRNSGLILPELEKWPHSSGYSFVGWIKIQDYTTGLSQCSGDASSSVFKIIWSMRAENGDGVELFIFKNVITLTVFRGGQSYSLAASELPLISKRWYFINICHAGPKLPWYANPEATIYINGVARVTGKLPYPDTHVHGCNRIGSGGFVPQTTETPSRKKFQPTTVSNDSIPDISDALAHDSVASCFSSFSGQMTCIYLMDDVLTQAQVEALHEIGQGHCSQFKSEDLASFPDVGKTLFDGSLHPKILLQLYPTATRNGNVASVCYDIGPRHLGDVEMRDVISCSSKCLQTAVHAFGGIEVTFPLISHLNHSIQPIPVHGMKRDIFIPLESSPAVRNSRLSIFLQMIALLLSNDIAHMERFAVVQGPRIMAMLLQQQDTKLLNMKSLDAVMAVVKIASDIILVSPKVAPPGSVLSLLGEELEESLVFEYRLWALTEFSVQFQHVEFLNHFLLANNDTHRAKYGISFLIDLLEKFYWAVPPDFLPPDLLAKLMLTRTDLTFVSKIRESIFTIMSDLVTKAGGIRPEECHRLVLTLWTCRYDPTHVLDILKFMIDRSLGFAANAVVESFLAHGAAMEVLLWLAFQSESEDIRISTMKLMLVLIKTSRTPQQYKRKLKLEEFPGTFTTATPSSHHCGTVLANNFAVHEMSRHFYLALLQLAVEAQILDWHSDIVVMQLTDLPNVSIVNSAYLVAILELLPKAKYTSSLESDKLISTALEDLLFIVTRSPGNSEQLRKIYAWQMLLVELLPGLGPSPGCSTQDMTAENTSTNDRLGGGSLSPVVESPIDNKGPPSPIQPHKPPQVPVMYDAILERIVEIFSTCILDSFVSDRRVWRLAEEMVVLVWISKKVEGMHHGMKIIGSILKGMMRKLRFDIQGGDADMFTGNTLENTYHLVSLVEEFLFSYHDLYDEILTEVGNFESSADNSNEQTSLIDAIAMKLNFSKKPRQRTGVQMAYPFHDNRNVAEECVELIGSLLEFGITHVSLADTADKAHTRPGGILRIQLRLLLNAISTGNHEVWATILPHFMSLFEKHAQSFCDGPSKNEMAHVLAQLTDAYKLSLKTTNESTTTHPTSQAIYPLFILVLHQWQEPVSQLWKAKDGFTLSKELLEQAESNLDRFNTLINSSAWTALYDEHFFPGSRVTEEEELSNVSTIKKRYSKVSKPVILKSGKESSLVSKLIANLESHLKILHTRRESEEQARLPESLSTQEVEKRLVARRWLAMFHELTQERGIWLPKKVGVDNNSSAKSTGLKWKLDRTENSMRMHTRLIPNFEFDDHKESAMRRDRSHGSKENLNTAEPESFDNSLSNLTSAERKKAKIDKLKSHYKSGASNDELRLVTNSMGALNVTEEDLVEEDWDLINNEEMSISAINVDSENFLFSCECEMILLMTAVKGRIELTSSNVTFFADIRATAANLSEADQKTLVLLAESEVLLRERRWPIAKLKEAYFRRYKLRNSALEFFFVDGANCFFNFKTAKPKMKLMTSIIRMRPVNLKVADVRNPAEMIAKSDVTERWQRHEISNFEYLMQLNTISGRTNNDLTQYPVFPWVLTDYKSEKIDLSDPSIYRDLSRPVGALDPVRLEQFIQRYESFEDPSGQIKKFMYGTHYSTSAAVLFYMLRMEPFTSLHIALQGGKFDHPDRQFDGMENCWKSVLSGNGDVKELIPEFFYMPEFLVNENDFDLGTKQTGTPLSNVVLPPWASTPEEFIRIHREALEGDYVSEHLHEWIDLIWGYKQTGPEAVKAHNVFYYLTYEGAINIDQIQDPIERRSIEDQINNFGQTPMQLFKKPHPKRFSRQEYLKPNVFTTGKLETGYSLFVKGVSGGSGYMPYISSTGIGGASLASGGGSGGTGGASGGVSQKGMKAFLGQTEKEKMITVDSNMVVGVHRWSSGAVRDNTENPFVFEADTGSLARRRLPCYFASNVTISQHLFAHSKDGKYLFTCGHWDSSFQVIALDNGSNSSPKSIDAVYGHHDIVTCLGLSEDSRTLVTGSRDTTVIAWELKFGPSSSNNEVTVKQDTRRVFYGHDEEVTCVAVNADQDLVVSGSKDGTCIVHALGSAQYLRTIRPQASILGGSTFRFSICKILITRMAGLVILSEESVRPITTVEDFSVCSNNERMETSSAMGGSEHSAGDSSNNTAESSSKSALLSRTRKSHLDVYSVNGKSLKTRQFDGVVGDLVSSDDGVYLILTIYVNESSSTIGLSVGSGLERGNSRSGNNLASVGVGPQEAGIVLEKLSTFTLKTIVKQKVEDETLRVENGDKVETVVHVSNNQQCLVVGYSSDKVLVLTA